MNKNYLASGIAAPKSTTGRRLHYSVLGLLVVTLLAEAGLRLSGITNFPVYSTDSEIGYVPSPNQVGSFLNANRWVINDRNMNVAAKFTPSGQQDLLLTGDSVVWGGNAYDQPDKLGSQLQTLLPSKRIWPISAGSWSVENVRVWCKRNSDVVREIDILVWVINDADFASASQWKTDATHPRSYPWSAIAYSLQKYVLPKLSKLCRFGNLAVKSGATPPAFAINLDSRRIFEDQLHEFSGNNTRCLLVLYPSRAQTAGENQPLQNYRIFRESLCGAIAQKAQLVEVLNEESWSVDWYRDDIHPSAHGCRVLAEIIRDHLERIPPDTNVASQTQ